MTNTNGNLLNDIGGGLMIVKYNSKLTDEMVILESNKTIKIYDDRKQEIGSITNLDADYKTVMVVNEKENQRFRIYTYINSQMIYFYGKYYSIVD